jgi:hypothetical protein
MVEPQVAHGSIEPREEGSLRINPLESREGLGEGFLANVEGGVVTPREG